jgi:hypothetical protein
MRSIAVMSLLALAAAAGCGKGHQGEAMPAAVTAPAEEGPRDPETPPAEPPADAGDIPAADPECVAECVEQSQMRAVAIEQIQADCERECDARAADL